MEQFLSPGSKWCLAISKTQIHLQKSKICHLREYSKESTGLEILRAGAYVFLSLGHFLPVQGYHSPVAASEVRVLTKMSNFLGIFMKQIISTTLQSNIIDRCFPRDSFTVTGEEILDIKKKSGNNIHQTKVKGWHIWPVTKSAMGCHDGRKKKT